ncbi:MAG: J domain-containing protein [Myxococcales bacterium]|nr:J domain-containing protein [Myxococcales bacterium]
MRDFYAALGLESRASGAEIKAAYRELTRRFHPDLNPGRQWADERYREVIAAYEVLNDPRRRELYDEFGEVAFTRGFDARRAREARRQRAAPEESAGDAAQAPGASGWGRDVMDFADFEEVKRTRFDSFLDRLFGRTPVVDEEAGLDLRATLTLRASEAIAGVTRPVRYLRADGGWTSADVTVEPGTVGGSQLRLEGLGELGDPPGALILDLEVEADEGTRIDGDDIHLDVDVTLRRLYAGGPLDLDTPFGRFEVKLPPATAPHKPLRLRGRGLPRGQGERGDLMVHLRLVMPTPGDARLLEALRRLQSD